MKGFEIKRESKKPIYLFNRYDVVSAIAHAIYYTANPDSDMCIPNCAYEKAEKMFDDWFNDTRIKKAIETLNEDDKLTNAKEIIGALLKHTYGQNLNTQNDFDLYLGRIKEAENFLKE